MENETILITGASGSWGNELIKQLLTTNVKEIRSFARGEFAQVMLARKFNDPRLKIIIGDVRDYSAVNEACQDVTTLYHLAATKHLPICEQQPEEAIKTNINGTINIIKAAIGQNVGKVVDVSTDKSCDPHSLYGATKLVGEKLVLNANKYGKTRFVCIRSGNVLATQGSCLPLFIQQINTTNNILVTDRTMTRYFITLPEGRITMK